MNIKRIERKIQNSTKNKDYQKAATMIEIFTEAGVVSNVADTLPIEE